MAGEYAVPRHGSVFVFRYRFKKTTKDVRYNCCLFDVHGRCACTWKEKGGSTVLVGKTGTGLLDAGKI